jgi:hypothetical protein
MKKVILALSLALLSVVVMGQSINKRAHANEDLIIRYNVGTNYGYVHTTVTYCSVPGAVSNSSNGEVFIPRTSFTTQNNFTIDKISVKFKRYDANGNLHSGGSKTLYNVRLYDCPMMLQNLRLTTAGGIIWWIYASPNDDNNNNSAID